MPMPWLGWVHRWTARRRLNATVGLWYHPEYNPPNLAKTSRVPQIVANRGEVVLGSLLRARLLAPRHVRVPTAASFADLERVHPRDYLRRTTEPEVLARIFALQPEDVDVDRLLGAHRLAVGGTMAAARAVASTFLEVGVNLGGGFHHAEPERGAGFCVYNDVAVAIAALRDGGYSEPIAVVDLDYHQGDGLVVTFANDPTVLTYSIHGSVWTHVDARANEGVLLPPGTHDTAYLEALSESLEQTLRAHGPRLMFYLAGNDVLAGDTFGDFELTPAGVLARDRHVVEVARRLGAGLVVTLAGGYGPQAWGCTASLVRWLLTDAADLRHGRPQDLRAHFSRIAGRISPEHLQGEPDDGLGLSEEDLLRDLTGSRRARRVLGYYSAQGVEYALERYGILAKLRERGFAELSVAVVPDDPAHQIIRVLGRPASDDTCPPFKLVELVVRRLSVAVPDGITSSAPRRFEMLSIEWLLLQDPAAHFTLHRPRFPGQQFPGLGLASEMRELLVQACVRLQLDGIVDHPAHYHVAAAAARDFLFLDPVVEGRFRVLRELLHGMDLAEATRLLHSAGIVDREGRALTWMPEDFVLPVSARAKAYFEDAGYGQAVGEAQRLLTARGLTIAPVEANPATGQDIAR